MKSRNLERRPQEGQHNGPTRFAPQSGRRSDLQSAYDRAAEHARVGRTNRLDLESIEALVEGLKSYPGTLILVSHDRWFVGQFATRIVEITSDGIRDYHDTYEEYVHACGDDHLDVDTVILKAKREKQGGRDRKSASQGGNAKALRKKLQKRQDGLTAKLEAAEARIKEIDGMFCAVNYFAQTPRAEVRKAEAERNDLEREVSVLTAEWTPIEEEMDD